MAFSYSSAINNLVAGAAENVADVVTCLTDVKTQFNSDTETAFSSYKQVVGVPSWLGNALASGTTYLLGAPVANTSGTSSTAVTLFYFDPADYTAAGRTNKYRLRVALATNATAPLSTLTFGLYPVSSVAGAANVVTPTLGAVTAGSTVAFAAQAASTLGQGSSGDFTAPAAGYYALAVAVTVAGMAANSAAMASAVLQYRQV